MNVIEGGKSDVDRAQDLKKQMMEALPAVMTVMDAAKAGGFSINFNLGPGPLGKTAITALIVTKEF